MIVETNICDGSCDKS